MKDALKESEEKFRTLAERSPNMIFINKNGRVVYANQKCEEIMGYKRDEFYSSDFDFMSLIAPESIESVKSSFQKHIQGKEINPYEYNLITKDGTRIPAIITTRLINYEGTKAILGIVTDITERKEAEEALQRYAERLKILREIDRAILSAQSPASIADAALNYICQLLSCLRASVTLFDLEAREAVILASSVGSETKLRAGTRFSLKDETIAELQQGKVAAVEDILSNCQALPIVQALRIEGIRSYINMPLIAHGKLIGSLNLGAEEPDAFTDEHLDITREVANSLAVAIQQAQLYEQVQSYTAELEQRVAARTAELEAFVYSVSHDLRAPLCAISGFAQIIARRHCEDLNEEGRHYLDNIIEASAQMDNLIDDLLRYSRLGRRSVNHDAVPLREVFRQVTNNLTSHIAETRAHLTFPDDMELVRGDRNLLRQIFTNLLDNAINYRRPGVPPMVGVSCYTEDEYVIVQVTDNGIGIPGEYHDKIFELFQRLHSQDEDHGGIGLSIVKKSVELLGGQVWVESTPGKGSSFFVKLPRAT
ncbi:MAG: PAS domain S-box protein [Candidatus Poribacteria bacterium]